MGREGMGRRHAAYKMVSMVLGTNIVRKELGLPEAECLAAEGRYSVIISNEAGVASSTSARPRCCWRSAQPALASVAAMWCTCPPSSTIDKHGLCPSFADWRPK
jgi:hypothetical protein